jgi:hypothetical protein
MANLAESAIWEAGIYQIERTDVVEAGVGGNGTSNLQAKQIANRLLYLKKFSAVGNYDINVNANPFDLTPYIDLAVWNVTASIVGATARAPEPAIGEAYTKCIRNGSANDVVISTPLGTDPQTLKAGETARFTFLRLDSTHTKVLKGGLTANDVVQMLAASPAIGTPTITNPTINGTVAGGASYTAPTITNPTVTGTVAGNPTITAPTLTSPTISGTVAGGASYTSPTITNPTVTGTVAGGASYTSPTLSSPTIGGSPVVSATSVVATGDARFQPKSDIAHVQTTDATVTTIFSWTIVDEAVTTVCVEASAVKSDGSVTASYVRRVRIKRDGGTVTVGTVNDIFTDEEAAFAACDITVDASGSTGRVRVTGIAATTIDWGTVVVRLEHTHA